MTTEKSITRVLHVLSVGWVFPITERLLFVLLGKPNSNEITDPGSSRIDLGSSRTYIANGVEFLLLNLSSVIQFRSLRPLLSLLRKISASISAVSDISGLTMEEGESVLEGIE